MVQRLQSRRFSSLLLHAVQRISSNAVSIFLRSSDSLKVSVFLNNVCRGFLRSVCILLTRKPMETQGGVSHLGSAQLGMQVSFGSEPPRRSRTVSWSERLMGWAITVWFSTISRARAIRGVRLNLSLAVVRAGQYSIKWGNVSGALWQSRQFDDGIRLSSFRWVHRDFSVRPSLAWIV